MFKSALLLLILGLPITRSEAQKTTYDYIKTGKHPVG
jgi:hypothetical protein